KVATPLPSRVPVPRTLAPSLNVTVPVGVPAPGATAVTVAVNVTAWPNTEGAAVDVSVVAALALLRVGEVAAGLLPLNLPSPTYWARMRCEPADSVLELKVATPLALSVPVPTTFVPSMKLTVPVGMPTPGATVVTVAVNVTDWPKSVALTGAASDVP